MVPAFLLQNQHFDKSVCTGAAGSFVSSGAATSACFSAGFGVGSIVFPSFLIFIRII